MRTPDEQPLRASFVVVLWLEPQKAAEVPEWRWHVSHVQTGERLSFRRLTDVLNYIGAKTGVSPPC